VLARRLGRRTNHSSAFHGRQIRVRILSRQHEGGVRLRRFGLAHRGVGVGLLLRTDRLMGAEFTQVYSRRFGSHAGEARVPAASESRARQAAARPAPFSKTEVTISALTLALAWYRQRRASAGLIRRSALCV
jgi:hypothetical protein